MKILNPSNISTAKGVVVLGHAQLSDLAKFRSKIEEYNINNKEILYVSLYDEKPSKFSLPELREIYKELKELIWANEINVVMDMSKISTRKGKSWSVQEALLFDNIFGKSSFLWTKRGIYYHDNTKWIAGDRWESFNRELNSQHVIDSEFIVNENDVEIIVITDEEKAKDAFRELTKSEEIFFDTEASGLRPFAKDFKLYTLQFTGSNNKNKSFAEALVFAHQLQRPYNSRCSNLMC